MQTDADLLRRMADKLEAGESIRVVGAVLLMLSRAMLKEANAKG